MESIENNIKKSSDTLTAKQREILHRDITETGLRSDVMHVWECITWVELGKFDRLKPALKYYEYLTKEGNYASADYVIQISNKENIAKYDAVIEEYNADFDRIIEEKDWEAVIHFRNKAAAIIYGSQVNLLDPKDWAPKSSDT